MSSVDHDHLFAFESDFVERLQCVPMAVRFKLDRTGIKLTLRQWSQLTPADRRELLGAPCETLAAVAAYRALLIERVSSTGGGTARPLAEPADTSWTRRQAPPDQVAVFARSQGVSPPDAHRWSGLSDLERFVLIKLSRDNHDNVNFVPAMREFGLAPKVAAP